MSVQEPTHQMQTYCEKKKSWEGTFKVGDFLLKAALKVHLVGRFMYTQWF